MTTSDPSTTPYHFTGLDRPCRSNVHADAPEPVAAVVIGTFDCSHVNGNTPEPDSAYCLRCAVLLTDARCFTPDDAETEIPSVDDFLARRGRGEIGLNGEPL